MQNDGSKANEQEQGDTNDDELPNGNRQGGECAERLGNLNGPIRNDLRKRLRGSAPKAYWPAFYSKRETPMAVIRTVSLGRSRRGR